MNSHKTKKSTMASHQVGYATRTRSTRRTAPPRDPHGSPGSRGTASTSLSSQNNQLRAAFADNEHSELNKRLADSLTQNKKDLVDRPHTRKAYDPVRVEFMAFCDYFWGEYQSKEQGRYRVDNTKLYKYLFFVAYRPRRPQGRPSTKKTRLSLEAEWDAALKQFKQQQKKDDTDDGEGASVPASIPTDVCGFNTVNTAKCSIQEFFREQKMQNINGLDWMNDIWLKNCQDLFNFCKSRQSIVHRANFKEKTDNSFAFFEADGKIAEIEEVFWSRDLNSLNTKKVFSSLRYV